jgi:hypothetical protein
MSHKGKQRMTEKEKENAKEIETQPGQKISKVKREK